MRVLILTALIVLSDQITKILVKGITIPALGLDIQGMRYGSSNPVIGEFFRLTYIENPGMAFGIDLGGKMFFSVFSVLASLAILFYLFNCRKEPIGFRLSLALILGGAVGNLIDRVFYGVIFNEGPLFYGKVVDFFDVDFFDITIGSYHMTRWPVFNIADASVTVGVILLLFFHRSVSPLPQKEKPESLVASDEGDGAAMKATSQPSSSETGHP